MNKNIFIKICSYRGDQILTNEKEHHRTSEQVLSVRKKSLGKKTAEKTFVFKMKSPITGFLVIACSLKGMAINWNVLNFFYSSLNKCFVGSPFENI